jgi:hypothetical protein
MGHGCTVMGITRGYFEMVYDTPYSDTNISIELQSSQDFVIYTH